MHLLCHFKSFDQSVVKRCRHVKVDFTLWVKNFEKRERNKKLPVRFNLLKTDLRCTFFFSLSLLLLLFYRLLGNLITVILM